jgi:hypothetical protein
MGEAGRHLASVKSHIPARFAAIATEAVLIGLTTAVSLPLRQQSSDATRHFKVLPTPSGSPIPVAAVSVLTGGSCCSETTFGIIRPSEIIEILEIHRN